MRQKPPTENCQRQICKQSKTGSINQLENSSHINNIATKNEEEGKPQNPKANSSFASH